MLNVIPLEVPYVKPDRTLSSYTHYEYVITPSPASMHPPQIPPIQQQPQQHQLAQQLPQHLAQQLHQQQQQIPQQIAHQLAHQQAQQQSQQQHQQQQHQLPQQIHQIQQYQQLQQLQQQQNLPQQISQPILLSNSIPIYYFSPSGYQPTTTLITKPPVTATVTAAAPPLFPARPASVVPVSVAEIMNIESGQQQPHNLHHMAADMSAHVYYNQPQQQLAAAGRIPVCRAASVVATAPAPTTRATVTVAIPIVRSASVPAIARPIAVPAASLPMNVGMHGPVQASVHLPIPGSIPVGMPSVIANSLQNGQVAAAAAAAAAVSNNYPAHNHIGMINAGAAIAAGSNGGVGINMHQPVGGVQHAIISPNQLITGGGSIAAGVAAANGAAIHQGIMHGPMMQNGGMHGGGISVAMPVAMPSRHPVASEILPTQVAEVSTSTGPLDDEEYEEDDEEYGGEWDVMRVA